MTGTRLSARMNATAALCGLRQRLCCLERRVLLPFPVVTHLKFVFLITDVQLTSRGLAQAAVQTMEICNVDPPIEARAKKWNCKMPYRHHGPGPDHRRRSA